MKTKILSLIVGCICFTTACSDDNAGNAVNDVKSQLKSAQLVEASNEFGINLFKKTNDLAPDKNLFVSPFSALQALSMTYNGANGITKSEMAKALCFKDASDAQVNEYNQSLAKALLNADSKVLFEIANSIWYRQEYNVFPAFIEVSQNSYNAEVKPCNFSDPSTLNAINDWCKNKTHEKIPTILDQIPDKAFMYLINAIYFKGSWQYSFDKAKTQTADFYLSNDAKVGHSQMMLQTKLKYFSNNDYSMVELPYGSGTFNFVILLPNYNKTVDDIINNMSPQQWKESMTNMTKNDVVVKMPKFKLECEGLLNKPLKIMGMPTAFEDTTADFSKITTDVGLYISRVIHKTFIDLNEEGTEAAAVTAVEMSFTSIGGETNTTKWFTANKPFVYAITEKSTGAILFIGKMINPTEEKTKFTE